MSVRDLIPWGRSNQQTSTFYRDGEQNPFLALHRDMNGLFDEAFRGFDLPFPFLGQACFSNLTSWGGSWPHVEIADSDNAIKVTADIPGLDEKDIEVFVDQGMLTIKAEKKRETETPAYSERWHGKFHRSIQLGPEVDAEKIEASFKNGVLTVTLPKNPDNVKSAKKIAISKN